MRHWIVMCLEVSDHGAETTILGVCHSREKAKEIFVKELPDIKAYAKDMGYTCVDESNPECFTATVEGFANRGSIELYIVTQCDEEEE